MDLIYMNSSMEDVGTLMDYDFDLAFGENENDFECRIASKAHCCDHGYYLYIEGTEYGGIVDDIQVDTDDNEVVYCGRTWHGILGSKVIMPLMEGESSTADVTIKTEDSNGASMVDRYLIISGDANHCIQFIIDRIGLSDLFITSSVDSGVNISAFKFDRFIDAYSGIVKMLASVKQRMNIEYLDNKVVISCVAQYDYATDEEFDPELVELRMKKRSNTVNHLVCLGSGEMENRMVIHLYADTAGNISQTQTQFGLNERTDVYDYSAVESEEEMMSQGIKRLKTLWQPDELVIKLDDTSDFYNVGDRVGAADNITGLTVSARIKKKIVNIKNGLVSVNLETDSSEVATASSDVSGGGTGGGTGGGSGSSTITSLEIGYGLKWVDNVLCVDTVDAVEEDNTKPITSSAVFVEVGNINVLLSTI